MSLLQVGRCNINMVEVLHWKREAVWANPTTYLYTRYTITVRGWLNPGTQSDRFAGAPLLGPTGMPGTPFIPPAPPAARPAAPGNPSTSPAVGPGTDASGGLRVVGAVSDIALRHQLMQPRQRITYSIGGVVVLQSPASGMTVDCTNGPRPLACDVEEVGPRTWKVQYTFQTDINEAFFFRGTNLLPVLLSNEWTMHHTLDHDFFTTRTVKGRATFRADGLALAGLVPDDFRKLLVHPIPFGFKRESVQVQAEPEGNVLLYEIVDRQLPLGWTSGLVTRIEATHTIRLTKDEPETALAKEAKELAGRLAEIGKQADIDPVRAAAVTAAGLTVSVASGVYEAFSLQPIAYHRVHVRLFGHPASNRAGLEQFGRDIITARLSNFFIAAGLPGATSTGADMAVTHDLVGKMVDLDYTIITGPIQTTITTAASLQFNRTPLPMTGGDNTADLLKGNINVTAPNDDNVSRGTYLETCVHAALVSPNAAPAVPPPVPGNRANPSVTI